MNTLTASAEFPEVARLADLAACADALVWTRTQPDAATAWATCERGDWMLWLLGRLSGEPESDARKKLVYTAMQCARLALSHW